MSSLRLESVSKEYSMGDRLVRALDSVSLEIQAGELVGIAGRSGSGKSTLLNLLAGMDRPSSGAIWAGNRNLAAMSSRELANHRQHTVGMIFQFFYLVTTMTALQNVALPMAFSGVAASQRLDRARSLLESVGLRNREDHLPAQLSGGEQQRVAIARALANDPEFLLADEPTGNLDSATAQEILSIFKELNAQGRTIICVTHEMELFSGIVGRFIRLQDGKVAN
ncbi:MAG: ABC transporter ATP-binding protein [Acidobacteria bacterium]|nr:ABC transporter ATP-binding protein [Acidobacteriota bacterium]